MFIAGDVSGDFHAASVVKQFSVDFPGAHIWGVGGPAMEAEGFDAVMPFEPFNKMGFVEVFRNITFFLNARKGCVSRWKSKTGLSGLCGLSGF